MLAGSCGSEPLKPLPCKRSARSSFALAKDGSAPDRPSWLFCSQQHAGASSAMQVQAKDAQGTRRIVADMHRGVEEIPPRSILV